MAKCGQTQIASDGVRTRQGTTPGGRTYKAQMFPSKNGNPGGGSVKIKSATTTWNKTTHPGQAGKPQASSKNRVIHEGHSIPGISQTFAGAKGPTKPKPGLGKTHTFPDGGKIRQGTTPGGRKYKAVKHASGYESIKVGGIEKVTAPNGSNGGRGAVSRKMNISTGQRVAKGQTKPK